MIGLQTKPIAARVNELVQIFTRVFCSFYSCDEWFISLIVEEDIRLPLDSTK